MTFRNVMTVMLGGLMLSACGGGSGGASSNFDAGSGSSSSVDDTLPVIGSQTVTQTTPTTTPTGSVTKVTVSGNATYDFVPHHTDSDGLDYNNIQRRPIRGATVQALNEAGRVIETGMTDGLGDYSLSVPTGQNIRIQILSQSEQVQGRSTHDLNIVDNVSQNDIYALSGSLINSGVRASTRNLHAPSGWDGASYASTRAAAPFAVLDTVMSAMDALRQEDSDVDFPELNIGWSVNNIAVYDAVQPGFIGTSSYVNSGPNEGMILLLGQDGADADEYDPHVILHEWAHYFENNISRGDSLGGGHSLHTPLDPRVAMSEGFATALAAIVLGDPVYRDSRGPSSQGGFSFDVESDRPTKPGWYSEASVQAIIYDLADQNSNSRNEDHDEISLGLGPIYNAMTSDEYRNQDSFATIFSLLSEVKTQNPSHSTSIDMLSQEHNISGQGYKGIGERNDGGLDMVLPLYKTYELGGAPTLLCSSAQIGVYNKLGNRDYVSVTLPISGQYEFTAVRRSGPLDADPTLRVFSSTRRIADFRDEFGGEESGILNLEAGTYRVEAYDTLKLTGGFTETACFNLSVIAL